MELQVEIAIIGLVQAIMVALIAHDGKLKKERDRKYDERAKLIAKESLVSMQMMSATLHLATATAVAVKKGEINGALDEALGKAQKVKDEHYDFLNETLAEKMAGR